MTTTNTPIKTHERELFMDALRGFAILGIFVANLNFLSLYQGSDKAVSPWLLPGSDDVMSFFHHLFIEGKFYSIFSLLFGWGIALQIKRGLDKGADALPTVKRRLLFMLLLGAMHLLIWIGDIVFFYALLGFLLLPFRKFSNKTLLITAAILILSPILLYWLKMTFPVLNYPAELMNQTGTELREKLIGINDEASRNDFLQHAGWFDHLKRNICGIFYRYGYLFFVSRIPKVLGMFLIGYVIGRSDFYKNLVQNKKIVYWTIGLGLLIGLPANYQLAQYMSASGDDYFDLKINGWYETIAYALGVAPLALAYVGMLMLSFQTTVGNKILLLISPVGKMAFSNYLMHSLIGNFVFLGAGLGYMGQVGPVYLTFFAIVVFVFQIILSTIWLKYFQYGPIEWVWRSLTYNKTQPIRVNSNQ
ncbi:DUF418 domain-containing protein [Flavobacterium sp. AS60]|uniref:DUF418 domain-containing protein n=1 Tax=Flavobacterium anseongense TaxID=2910677 RepID=UPI001F3723AA|nr:DUF418 domain-containing protein [Flavobacterium sp. AS60]MCF6130055.1 DUF418 domain-containing protein [Flavobacterium sp. AS60]